MFGKIIFGSLLKIDTRIKTMKSLVVLLSVSYCMAINNSGSRCPMTKLLVVHASSEYGPLGVLNPNYSHTHLTHRSACYQ